MIESLLWLCIPVVALVAAVLVARAFMRKTEGSAMPDPLRALLGFLLFLLSFAVLISGMISGCISVFGLGEM